MIYYIGVNMKIITVNLTVESIETIKLLIGENGLFPSRSELMRAAIRDFLKSELEIVKKLNLVTEKKKEKIHIPMGIVDGKQTYKIVKIIQKGVA